MEAANHFNENPPKTPVEMIFAFFCFVFAGMGTFLKSINTFCSENLQTAEFFMYVLSGTSAMIVIIKYLISKKKHNGKSE